MEFLIKMQPEHVNAVLAGLDELQHKTSRRAFDHILQQVKAQEEAAKVQQQPAPTDAGLTD